MSKRLSKKERALELFRKHSEVFRCPICAKRLVVFEPSGLRCGSNHNFDLAKNGYLNLLNTHPKSEYGKELFLARRKVFSSYIFHGLWTELYDTIENMEPKNGVVLDAGCGEGLLLSRLYQRFPSLKLIGLDISRDGIKLAASHAEPIIWCVGDLAQLPLNDRVADVVLNILSPANYSEFERVLKHSGYVIKVIPGEEYLQEIRELVNDTTPYNNQDVMENLKDNMNIVEVRKVHYKSEVVSEFQSEIIKMTPLTSKRGLSTRPIDSLTIDLNIVRCSFN